MHSFLLGHLEKQSGVKPLSLVKQLLMEKNSSYL